MPSTIKFIDLFCGIGGFRYASQQAFQQLGIKGRCLFSCDIDKFAAKSYRANFGEEPAGDITKVDEKDIPDFDLLFAGFPCQAFSICGLQKGFADSTKGTLFFDIARILKAKQPNAFVLENVKNLVSHDGGRTFQTIIHVLREELGYFVDYKVLNALDFGLPQKRERIVIVGAKKPFDMDWRFDIILTFAWTLKAMTDSLGAAVFVADIMNQSAGSLMNFLPAIIFLVGCFLAFSTGTSWGTFGILIPIVVAVFAESNPQLMIISISACMAGAVCGDHCSPISDTTIMASAGAQCNHVNHVTTQIPYVLVVASVSFLTYIIAGFVKSPWICLPIGMLLLFPALLLMKGKG